MGIYGSFSYSSSTGMHCGSITPVTSVARSQQVTSSGWQQARSFSPLLAQAMDTLSAEQAAEIYQHTAKCQALGFKLAKQFQNLSRLEAVHHATAQAAAHKTINVGCMACSAAFGIATATQTDEEHESYMCRFHTEANQAWKDASEVVFSHLLKYDTQWWPSSLPWRVPFRPSVMRSGGASTVSQTQLTSLTGYACLWYFRLWISYLPFHWTSATVQAFPWCSPMAQSLTTSRLEVPLEMGITI